MNLLPRTCLTLLLLLASLPALAQETDAEGCKDHPLFNRMPGYLIGSCEAKQFDARDFPASSALEDGNKPAKLETVEGAQTTLFYTSTDGNTHPSALQIARNYQNAVKAAGGVVLAEFGAADSDRALNTESGWGDRVTVLKLNKGGKEIWAEVLPHPGGGGYALYIGEREAMQQDIAANELLDKINKDGFIALYLNFNTGKATIKPDSLPQLEQVAQALKSSPDLKLEVAGHTDNVGKPDANQKLSEARAQAVMKALTDRGIAAARLSAKGYGQSKPLADNKTEDGRAKNRRVELVKK